MHCSLSKICSRVSLWCPLNTAKKKKKRIAIWDWNGQFMGFLCLLICDSQPIEQQSRAIEQQSREPNCISLFIILNKFFVLDLKVHHSNSMRLTFCHGLPTLQTQILTLPLVNRKCMTYFQRFFSLIFFGK